MTEREWLACNDPELMLKFLQHNASDRKLRLFAVACCRRIWRLLRRKELRLAVKASEQWADRLISSRAFTEVGESIKYVRPGNGDYTLESYPQVAAVLCASKRKGYLRSVAYYAAMRKGLRERIQQSNLLREIFGNPFRPISCQPAWVNLTVTNLAHGIYTDRTFDRLLILGDALEEAGCTNADILTHCRSGGVHVRGCWVVDLLLGKD